MKHVVTYILKEGQEKEFTFQLNVGKRQDPEIVIRSLLMARNRTRLEGTEQISLVKVVPEFGVSYRHDWERMDDMTFKCIDCGVRGRRDNPLQVIRPIKKNPIFKDCSWIIE